MNVKDLIDYLSKQDPELRVMVGVNGGEFDIYEPVIADHDDARVVVL